MRSQVAHLISETFSEMMFGTGFVHCDPHAANMLIRVALPPPPPPAADGGGQHPTPADVATRGSGAAAGWTANPPRQLPANGTGSAKSWRRWLWPWGRQRHAEASRLQLVLLDHGLYRCLCLTGIHLSLCEQLAFRKQKPHRNGAVPFADRIRTCAAQSCPAGLRWLWRDRMRQRSMREFSLSSHSPTSSVTESATSNSIHHTIARGPVSCPVLYPHAGSWTMPSAWITRACGGRW